MAKVQKATVDRLIHNVSTGTFTVTIKLFFKVLLYKINLSGHITIQTFLFLFKIVPEIRSVFLFELI